MNMVNEKIQFHAQIRFNIKMNFQSNLNQKNHNGV